MTQAELLVDADVLLRIAADPAVQHDKVFVAACITRAAQLVELARQLERMRLALTPATEKETT